MANRTAGFFRRLPYPVAVAFHIGEFVALKEVLCGVPAGKAFLPAWVADSL